MDANKKPDSDLLDITFDNRSKHVTNDPQKTYNKRLTFVLLLMAALFLLIILGTVLSNTLASKVVEAEMIVQDVLPERVKRSESRNEGLLPSSPPLPLTRNPRPLKVEMVNFTPLRIVKNVEMKEDEILPQIEKPEDTSFDPISQDAIKDEGIVAPPASDEGKGVIEAPGKMEEDWDKTFTKVEIDSEYPGGISGWQLYLNESLQYPKETIGNEIQGTIEIQFIVDKEGNVSDVEAISGPNELCEKAIGAIRKSGKWIPAVQNGRHVQSRKKQPITFRLLTEQDAEGNLSSTKK